MSDTTERQELLERLVTENYATELLLQGALMIAEGGVEGIQTVAAEQPEIIINAIVTLSQVVRSQTQRFNALIEAELNFEDFLAAEMEKHGITPPQKN